MKNHSESIEHEAKQGSDMEKIHNASASSLHTRLHKIAGQINGIDRMIDRGASCEDILVQLNAARAGLLGCAKLVLGDCAKECIMDSQADVDADKDIEDFLTALDRFTAMV